MAFVFHSTQQHSNPANGPCQEAEEDGWEMKEWEINGGGGAGTGNESRKLVHLAELVP